MKKGYTSVDHSYNLPPGMSKYFLTGTNGEYNPFDIEEIEVFQVETTHFHQLTVILCILITTMYAIDAVMVTSRF